MAYGKILIISDNENIARLLRDFLLREEYETIVSDTKKALSAAALNPDLIIVQLEREDGLFDSLVTLNIPLFVLIPEKSAFDRVMLFERGADELMTVPFDAREAAARSKALLRRSSAHKGKREICELDGLTVNLQTYTITCEGSLKTVPAKETELLFLLAANIGRVFSRREILELIWHTADTSERIVDTHISRLRGAIAESAQWEIVSVRAAGYKFDKRRKAAPHDKNHAVLP